MCGHWIGMKISPSLGKGDLQSNKSRQEYVWKALKRGWYKLNFDRASRGNPCKIPSIGCSIHNDEGIEIESIAIAIGEVTTKWENISSLIEGQDWCKELGLKKLKIEGDSSIIINALRKGSLTNSRLDTQLSKSFELCKYFDKLLINCIYHKGNKRMDELEN